MPLPIDIEVVEGTSISDGIQTFTNKETSHIRLLSLDEDGFVKFELAPPKKVAIKTLREYYGEDQLIHTETTIVDSDGKPLAQYKYYKRGNGSYYSRIIGQASAPHTIELGKFTEQGSALYAVAKTIAYRFDTKKFSRNDLKPLLSRSFAHGQKIKSILDVLHHEGYLIKEIDPSSRNKAKELYSATENLKKVVIPSPSPEQA